MVWPSGETSTDIHVPSLVSKEIERASARGLLMSAATSGFFSLVSSLGGSCARAAGGGERMLRKTSVANVGNHLRIGPPSCADEKESKRRAEKQKERIICFRP